MPDQTGTDHQILVMRVFILKRPLLDTIIQFRLHPIFGYELDKNMKTITMMNYFHVAELMNNRKRPTNEWIVTL